MVVGDIVYARRTPTDTMAFGVVLEYGCMEQGEAFVLVKFFDGAEEYFHPTQVHLLKKTEENLDNYIQT